MVQHLPQRCAHVSVMPGDHVQLSLLAGAGLLQRI